MIQGNYHANESILRIADMVYIFTMVQWEDMTPDERDRFIYLSLGEDALKAIVLIMQRRHGPNVSTEKIMRFAFKIARDRMVPAHLKKQ